MKHFLVLLLFSVITLRMCAQGTTPLSIEDQNKLIHEVSSIGDADAKLKAIDELIRSGKLTFDGQIASLYSGRAQTLWEVYELHEADSKEGAELAEQMAIDSVLAYYKKAIDACVFCQPVHRQERAQFLHDVDKEYNSPYAEDMTFAKDHGYKETQQGFLLGVNYMGGKSDWFGVTVSPFGQIAPRYKIMNTDPADGKVKMVDRNLVPVSLNLFPFEYNQNLNQPTSHELSLSLFQMTSPLLINVTKLGFTQSFETPKPSWFYRPEIGIGWGFISVGYAYNFVFSKSDRHLMDTHMFVLKVSYPIVMYKN